MITVRALSSFYFLGTVLNSLGILAYKNTTNEMPWFSYFNR